MDENTPHIAFGCAAFTDKKLPILKKPEFLTAPQIELSEIPHLGKLNIRCDSINRDEVSKLIQCNLPAEPNYMSNKAGRFAVSLGPDEYLLLAEPGSESQLEQILRSSHLLEHISVVNVSDAFCAIRLSGIKVRELLSKGCPIDLHPNNFYSNRTAQCELALANVILICLEDNEFVCICRTSFAEYVLDWCIDAGQEYGILISKKV